MFQTSLANISVTNELWIQVFWVISVQYDLRNTLPKSRTFLLLHPVVTMRGHTNANISSKFFISHAVSTAQCDVSLLITEFFRHLVFTLMKIQHAGGQYTRNADSAYLRNQWSVVWDFDYFCLFWRDSPPPQWFRDTSFKKFLDHTHNDAPQSVGLL